MSSDASVARLQALLRIPTISRADPAATDWAPFELFVSTLAELYPLVHTRLEREIVAGHSLLFRWTGRASDEPSVLMAHYDVVAATDEGWKHPPFAGELSGKGAERLIWGRGTLDDKGAVTSILEAVESQLEAGLVPRQDIYLVFTHDEETNGTGAIAVVDLLESRGIRPTMVLDEGGAIAKGAFPKVDVPVAVVGVGEKGTTTLSLVVEQQGGHASTPPELTATVRLARAVVRLNDRPFPASLNAVGAEMFRTIGVHAPGLVGFAYRHPVLMRLALPFSRRLGDELNAMVRTTQAVTMLEAGQAVNALAERASATVNVRVAVGSTIADVVKHVTRAIRDEAVRVEVVTPNEAAPLSPMSGLGWELIRSTVEKNFPGTVVTPYVQNGATDSRQFTRISRGVYRFTPFEMSKEERGTLHAKNERMHVRAFIDGIQFYRALVAAL